MKSVNLIINADDYGYSDGISRGILKAAKHGVVKATGILANMAEFDKHIEWLTFYDNLDVGVHLNLTSGWPLSDRMRALMQIIGSGRFPSNKFAVASAVILKKIPVQLIEEEWELQIQRCLHAGLDIRFLNSHEHIHGLPLLYSIVRHLAIKYNIPHVRVPAPEWPSPLSVGGLVRAIALLGLCLSVNKKDRQAAPRLLGVSCSGKLTMRYVEEKILSLQPAKTYELMCHPGEYVPDEITDPNLLAYHDWDGELRTLCDSRFTDHLRLNNISVIGYRDLPVTAAA